MLVTLPVDFDELHLDSGPNELFGLESGLWHLDVKRRVVIPRRKESGNYPC